jgi:hypothetical protein
MEPVSWVDEEESNEEVVIQVEITLHSALSKQIWGGGEIKKGSAILKCAEHGQ